MQRWRGHWMGVGICAIFVLTVCQGSPAVQSSVVVYTAVDQPYAEPIFLAFTQKTGIQVKAVYDMEAAKTTGLVNRLIAEKEHPQADVFWNNEIIQTIRLKTEGVLQPYQSPNAEQIPDAYRDPQSYWTGMTARARVLIINTDLVDDPGSIDSLQDFLDERFPARLVGIAYPLFGTTATHAAALYQIEGTQRGREFFKSLVDRGVQVVDGNAVVRDLVASGALAFGLTDTDDACGALSRGDPVVIQFPDQAMHGVLLLPSTISMLAGAPHPHPAQALIDFLLLPETEQMLLDAGFSAIPLHPGLQASQSCIDIQSIYAMPVDYTQLSESFEMVMSDLREIFVR